MNLQERLQQLAQRREQLFVALHEVNGAMKILEEQILEIQETSEAVQPSNKEALKQSEETVSST
jgi:predicted  nucleic acid-binding Zn-ribbon protein|tara:strand:- start:115 stop:306 length:192 start_codon:yes stop_codon:yes gene_type:complete